MNENPIAIELKAMAQRLRELFPEAKMLALESLIPRDDSAPILVRLHRCGNYQAGSDMLRRIGIGERTKRISDPNWCAVEGEADGVKFTAFVDGLPPSCRIETVMERIPKTSVVETGEFVEVPRKVVKCNGAVA